ncbi:(2Fe-2S)-binding protein [Marinoscillum sp. MHG1-6]|uniref:2Fe-2S iron-sulfur cluster-binding protein n=1 Tax=Marinoscillum sp. MHG1-6 TaxID=2959627 RepID=UPI0021586284|nr:(2Fe-2S)-binding protein [Marinoscillum sp. MHG1-6]
MPEVIIENLHSKAIHCETKTERLLDILSAETDWMSTCGGRGMCTTCAAQILHGGEQLNHETEAELKWRRLGKLPENERLACQCLISKDVSSLKIRVPDRNKFPGINYSD